jgi:chromatin remodeling complex protein RSC6
MSKFTSNGLVRKATAEEAEEADRNDTGKLPEEEEEEEGAGEGADDGAAGSTQRGWNAPYILTPALAAIVGCSALSRPQVTKRLWV